MAVHASEKNRPAALLIPLALAAACLAVYGRALHFDFINFDDNRYVYENPWIRSGLTRAGLAWAFSTFDNFYWQPLTWFSHMLDCELFGLSPGWHHFTSILLHIGNSILVFVVFRRMTGALWRSAVVAALFAVHPLRLESVLWVAERKDVLSTFFFLLTVWAYTSYAAQPSGRRYAAVLAAMVMGLMSKPMLVTVPFLLLLLDYWPLRRAAPLMEKFPMFFLAGISSLVTLIGTKRMGAMEWAAGLPITLRVSNALVSYVRYIAKAVWPEDLAIFYPYPESIPAWQWLGAAAILLALTGAAICFGRWRRYLATGWFWFVIGLAPTIGLVQVGAQAMADRFTYIPLIGLFAAAVWGSSELLSKRPTAAAAVAGAMVTACAVTSWALVPVWRDSITAFSRAVAVTRDNSLAHNNLAKGLEAQGRVSEALPHYAEALRIDPRYFVAHYNYALALLNSGDTAGAVAHLSDVVRYCPTCADGHYRLGLAQLCLGRVQEGAASLKRALREGLNAADAAEARKALDRIAGKPVA